MKMVFFSSVLNHHQLPLCLEFYKALGNNFIFVSTMEMEEQRRKLGYEDMAEVYPFCLQMHKSPQNYSKAYKLSQECNVLIAGVIPSHFIFDRMKKDKLTFRYSERFYKDTFWRILSPRALKIAYEHHFRFRKSPLYLLCASAYLPKDASRIFSYPNKMFKWGYFPEFKQYDIEELIKKKEADVVKILWVGRFLDCKQPEHVLYVAEYLNKKGVNYSIEMIGLGPIRDQVISMTKKMNIQHNIDFLGAVPPEQVRKKMEQVNIFLFTSNKQEGWGVVLNEALNSGCAVVANQSAGAVPFLIKDGYNGLTYTDKDINGFCKHVEILIHNIDLRRYFACNAYKTIAEEWNPSIAAQRLLEQIDSLMKKGEKLQFPTGPMSFISGR